MTDEKDQELDDRVDRAVDDAKAAADRAAREAAGTLDAMKVAAADAAQRGAAAVSDAADHAKAAGAKLTGAAGDVDLDEVLSETRALAGEWTERLKQAYRDRPGVVIAAAVGALVVTAAVVRAISRR